MSERTKLTSTKRKFFLSALVGLVASGGLFLVILCLLWFVPTVDAGVTAAYFWIAPALLIQVRAPSEAVYDAGVAPPDLKTWILCFLFWAGIGAWLYLWLRRMVAKRQLRPCN